MSFRNTIEAKLTEAVDQSLGLSEASLKVSNFTGKIADKAGFKMKKVGDCNPGASVVLTGDEKAIVSYAKKYLGAEGDKISDFQSDLIGGPGCQFESADLEEAKKEDKMDAVGKEDDDIDNDGDSDSSDEYLKKKRAAIAKTMNKDKLKEMAKASKQEHIKGGLTKGADGYSSYDYHRIAIALAGGRAAYEKMPYGIGQRFRDKAKDISNSEKDSILRKPTPQ
jgi:hypothetical protein